MQQLTERSWRKLKSVLHPLPPRAENAYSTLIPVLIGLAGIRPVRRVLEFGCGRYSTTTFLKRSAFPDLTELQSVENDAGWAGTMREAVKEDRRCVVTAVRGAMCDAVRTFDLETFDLILVDDSTNAEQRAATIRALSDVHPLNPWVVIHDYEVEEYRRASSTFKQRFTFTAYNPRTGLISNSDFPSALKTLNQRLKDNSSRLAPDNVEDWLQVLRT
jgi:hypothetical protein